ncbi:hypothetical protein QYH69_32890 [Paraburkholderia sp. SARCC-3016]|uniref:hypothetical protein n=1 Tax=Paraburkholderia sp. SARCC-3016 TaxID=3058611 RepID=UPI002806DE98|nr:hypothetical protein [Paraburkholderia sp. SARCC-3016]MDQ7982023.1 hypothetical protein [Paraburkholderia sp. SARCC-3016]
MQTVIHFRLSAGVAVLALTLFLHASSAVAQQTPDTSAMPFHSDDPAAVRAALADKPEDGGKRTLRSRLHDLVAAIPHGAAAHGAAASSADPAQRRFVFVVDAPLGILYRAKTRLLTVDVPLADDDRPGYIVLKKTVTGKSGRRLVIAPDAKAKGYVQHIDRIDLATSGKRTTAHGRLRLSQTAFNAANGDFAVAIRCHLVPPYMTDVHAHQDPTDEEPTDITTRISTLHAEVDEVWLIDVSDGTVLTTKLSLTK